jgi:predicted PurR-regulated permease PerM
MTASNDLQDQLAPANVVQDAMPTEHFFGRYTVIAFWVLASAALIAAGLMVAPFFPAIMWAAVFSVLTWKTFQRVRARLNDNLAAAIVVIGTLVVIVVPILLVGLLLFVQVNEFLSAIRASQPTDATGTATDHLLRQLDTALRSLLSPLGIRVNFLQWFDQNKQEIVKTLTAQLGKATYTIGYTVFTFVIALLTMFFMLRDGSRLLEPTLHLLPLPREKSRQVLAKMGATIQAVFVGVVLVALVQGSVAGITYWAVGVPHPLIWFVATTILAAIPLLGAPVIYIPLAIMLIGQGKVVQGVVLLAVGFGIVSQIDNVLRPFVIGARTALHPMAVFFSLLGGILMFGPVGVMAGPVLLTLVLGIAEIVRERRELELGDEA